MQNTRQRHTERINIPINDLYEIVNHSSWFMTQSLFSDLALSDKNYKCVVGGGEWFLPVAGQRL